MWASQMDLHILLLTETWLWPHDQCRLPGYSVLRNDRVDGKGGVIMAIRDYISFTQLPLNFRHDTIQLLAVKVDIFTIIVAYVKPESTVSSMFWSDLLRQVSPPVIFAGDFNAHNRVWGSCKNNKMGRLLEDVSHLFDLQLLNSDASTLFTHPPSLGSILDLTFASISICNITHWKLYDCPMGSNHLPSLITINHSTAALPDRPITSCPSKIKIHDWSLYRTLIQRSMTQRGWHPASTPSITEINSLMLDVALNHFQPRQRPKGRRKYPSVSWWDLDCKNVVAKRKLALTLYRKHMTQINYITYKRMDAQVLKVCKRKKRDAWRNFTNSLQPTVNVTHIWRKLKRVKGSLDPPRTKSPISTDILTQFHINFAPPAVRPAPYTIPPEYTGDITELTDPFTLNELLLILQQCKDTAPGLDALSYNMYKQLPPSMLRHLLNAYNSAFLSSCIPAPWSVHKLIPLPKSDFNSNNPARLRPIILTSCSRNFFEKLLQTRLQAWSQNMDVIPSWQFAFLKGRSAADCIATLTMDILLAFHRKEICTVLFLDLQSAYDLININVLLSFLTDIKLPVLLLRILKSLLSENTSQVVHQDYSSDFRTKFSGLNQGGILSPFLFNLFVSKLGHSLRQHARTLQFADDFAIYVSHKSASVCTLALHNALLVMEHWCQHTGMEVSLPKLRLIAFSKKKTPDFCAYV